MAEDSPHIWLIDNLAADIPRLRVWTYEYGSTLHEQGSGEDVYGFADAFVRHLRHLRSGIGVSIC